MTPVVSNGFAPIRTRIPKAPKIPPGWRWTPLLEVARLESGHTPSRRKPEYWEGGQVPWVSLKDVSALDGKVIYDTTDKPTEEGIANSSARLLPAGTVALCRTASVGKLAILGREMATSQDFVNWVCGPNLDPTYLYWAFRASELTFLLEKQGSTHQTIYMPTVRKFAALLPPLVEQRRIAAILDKADAIRRKRRDAIALTEELLRSTFLEMFGDPVTNPKGFPTRVLSDFYINQRDGTKCGPFGSALKKSEYVPSGVPVWNMDNISKSGAMVLPFRMWITEEKFRALEAYSVVDGDVLISRAGTVGKMCVATSGSPKSIISTNLIRVRFGPGLLPIYFVSLMNYCKGRVGRLRTGADGAFTHMNTRILDKLQFPYPPIQLQTRFEDFVRSAQATKASLQRAEVDADNLFHSLVQRAFRGDL